MAGKWLETRLIGIPRAPRHLLLGGCSAAGVVLFVEMLAEDGLLYGLSMGTAYVGLVLMALTLLLGPWRVLRRRTVPVSTYLRRDVGIWAAVLSIAHVVIALQRHMGGNMLLYFIAPPEQAFPLRIDAFGIANHIGLVATLLLIMLLALSNDASLRALGPPRWKRLQRLNYLGAALVVVHSVLFQFILSREAGLVAVLVAVTLVTALGQALGARARRTPPAGDAAP